jgi:hypothetical protein
MYQYICGMETKMLPEEEGGSLLDRSRDTPSCPPLALSSLGLGPSKPPLCLSLPCLLTRL